MAPEKVYLHFIFEFLILISSYHTLLNPIIKVPQIKSFDRKLQLYSKQN